MSAEKIIYEEFRGAEGLVYAVVTEDTFDTYTAGEVKPLAGLGEVKKQTEVSTDTRYYDNGPAIIIEGEGEDKITLSVSIIRPEAYAEITEQYYDAEHQAVFEGAKLKPKYYALGYITETTSGKRIFVWRYKGKFSIPDSNSKTKDNGTDSQGQEIIYTAVKTKRIWAELVDEDGNKLQTKGLAVPESAAITEAVVFADVFTPDKYAAKKNS